MTILWFVLGTVVCGMIATTIMAMLFIAKRADENRVVVSDHCAPELIPQEPAHSGV